MLIKRKLHWIGERNTGKIHPEKPHRNSHKGKGETGGDSRRMNRERKRDRQERDRWEKRRR